MKLHIINAGNFKLDGGAMFGVVPKSIWQKTNPGDSNNLCNWSMRCLLVETAGRRILIDTGMGDKQNERFFSHYEPSGPTLAESLAIAGFEHADITDVFLTHLHFDHCGGAIQLIDDKLVPAFSNARYWSNQEHWNWAIKPNGREKASFLSENILPLQESGQLNMIQKEGLFCENFSVSYFHGHTEAMMVPYLTIGDKTLVYCADALPSTGHIPLPYIMAYDTRPLLTLTEKQLFLKEAADKEQILFFEHDPVNECCTVIETEKGVRMKESGTLANIIQSQSV